MVPVSIGVAATDMAEPSHGGDLPGGLEHRGIFERPAASFGLDPRVIGWIQADPANPLNRIATSIPDGACVLDIGAGNGILVRLLTAAGRATILDAVEPDAAAREFSGHLYREMFACSLEDFLQTAPTRAERYDVIVMADVVEHLANPEPLLAALKSLLTDGGFIALSTPNIAFASVRLALLEGRFDYVDSGILERTHLRFYTRRTLQRLFDTCGLYPLAEYHCVRDALATEIVLDDQVPSLWLLARLSRDELASVYQFLFLLGVKPRKPPACIRLGSQTNLLLGYVRRRISRWLRRQ